MRPRALLLSAAFVILALAGCSQSDSSASRVTVNVGMGIVDDVVVHFAPGAVSSIANSGADRVDVRFTSHTLTLTGTHWDHADHVLVPGASSVQFLPPPGNRTLNITLVKGGSSTTISIPAPPPTASSTIMQSASIVENLKFIAANFPHRNPGSANYPKSLDWAAAQLRAANYTVTVDEYHTLTLPGEPACVPERFVSGQQICPQVLANIVAVKPGTDPNGPVIVIGGHYDIVPQVTYGAYDNTAGALAVMALATAVVPYTFAPTLVFALWGGEESGTFGSASWLSTHPVERARMNAYWNFDTIGLSWPAPLTGPQAMHIGVGPETGGDAAQGAPTGAVRDRLVQWARGLEADAGYQDSMDGAPFVTYGGVVEEVATTDHLAFIAEGVPSFVPDTIKAVDPVIPIHTEKDTLENMTRYAYIGTEQALDAVKWPDAATKTSAEDVVARSFEPAMWFAFYHVMAVDEGRSVLGVSAAAVPTA